MASLEEILMGYNQTNQQSAYQTGLAQLQGIRGMAGLAADCGAVASNSYSGFAAAINETIQPKKEKTLFQEIKNDVTGFIKEHRGVIYFIALALLIDHFIFKGVFKARLQAMLESLIAKVETKVSAA